MTRLRKAMFHGLRLIGGFALAQRLTRNKLRILCYHGFSVSDEHETAPYVFMRKQTFEERLHILRRRRIPVISLDVATNLLEKGAIHNCETVITLDDGWATNLMVTPLLRLFNYPACIYVTTEHLSARTDAFNVIVGHMLARTRQTAVTFEGIHPLLDGRYEISNDPLAAAAQIVERATKIRPLDKRQNLLEAIARPLGFEYSEVVQGGKFQFLTGAQITALANSGVDIQLHTHSHNLPIADLEGSSEEILSNQRLVTELTGKVARHFCYPSGKYGANHPSWLKQLGIQSATTCDPGLNGHGANPLLLKRYVDSESTSAIEFEAEICGLRELLRITRSWLQAIFSRPSA